MKTHLGGIVEKAEVGNVTSKRPRNALVFKVTLYRHVHSFLAIAAPVMCPYYKSEDEKQMQLLFFCVTAFFITGSLSGTINDSTRF